MSVWPNESITISWVMTFLHLTCCLSWFPEIELSKLSCVLWTSVVTVIERGHVVCVVNERNDHIMWLNSWSVVNCLWFGLWQVQSLVLTCGHDLELHSFNSATPATFWSMCQIVLLHWPTIPGSGKEREHYGNRINNPEVPFTLVSSCGDGSIFVHLEPLAFCVEWAGERTVLGGF